MPAVFALPTVSARRLSTVGALAALSVFGLAAAASAHVTVNPGTAEQGGFTKVSFRVPNERDDASTTKVQVDLPTDTPVAFVSVRPVPGWTVKVEKSKLKTPVEMEGSKLTEAVSRITWSGGKIDAGQFQEFDVSMGPLPSNATRMLFKAEQTYTGGEVVKWDQDPGDGQNEPEHPAPELKLTPKGAAQAAATGPTAQVKPAAAAPAEEDASDGTARVLGGIGVAVGVIGLGVGGYGLSRARGRA
ncbi:YcnI family protein [Actinomadura sp. NEAU-AAG7]|uniref:YcnI family copper-binding membrane protein n=1 Tax=Actinomadura sp. NEAU-AAG7 TaxID=2839640 RepID=UPI001BE4D971|nr:YcnI family protein [Actinomadura sp. NEAU-AAG7]MBT2207407.1 YcnI family protein [Actinomadura sp. NEAU-AAG7]